jgi:HD superfamily phosphohydrolase YqeK
MKKELDLERVLPEIGLIRDEDLRKKTAMVWERLWAECKWEDIMDLPCSMQKKDYPHVFHNRAVIKMALQVADTLEEFHGVKVNRDHLVCAGLLQDASKLVEMPPAPGGGVAASQIGENFTHGLYGGHVALDMGIPYDIVQAVLTHTADSSVFPQTLIGKILFYADQIDMAALGGDRWKKIGYTYR